MNGLAIVLWAGLGLGADPAPAVGDAAERIAAARQHCQAGRYAESLEACAALAGEPALTPEQRAQAALIESRALQDTGEWDTAAEAIREALPNVEQPAALLARQAELELLRGRYEDAARSAAKAIELNADLPLAHLVQGHVARETGRFDDALKEYQWCVRYYNRVQPTDPETLLVIAEGSLEYARWKRANNIFSFVVNTLCPDALKADEHCWQAHYVSGSLLLEKYNQAQAVPELNEGLAINAQAAPVLAALGASAMHDMDVAKAEEYADRALQVNPRLPEALLLKADIRLADGNTPAALEFIEQALAINPVDQQTLARKAVCYLLEDGVPADEELVAVFFHLDTIGQLDLPQPSRFSQVLIDVARRNPRPGKFLAIVGEFLDAHRKYAAAERFYQQAINVMPQLSDPKTNLGMLYMRTGQVDEAQRILDEAFNADRFQVRVSNMRKVLGVLQGYETVATDHFVLRVDKSDRLLASYMAEYLESIYPELTERYGFEPPVRTQFEIYGAAKGQGAHEWFSARMVGLPWIQTIGASTGMIVALASPTAMEPFNWSRVLRHEFVHILTLQDTQFNIPHWYTEALAVREEGLDMPDEWQEILLDRVPKRDIFTLETVNSGFQRPKGPTDWNMAYCQSRLYAKYMEEQYGTESLEKLLDAYRHGKSTPEAIPEVFGVSVAEFEVGYLKLLDKIVGDLYSQRAPPRPTLKEARGIYEENKEDADAAGAYARALLDSKSSEEAAVIAQDALERNPAQADAAYVLARLALAAEDPDGAIEYLAQVIDEQRPHAAALSMLARLRLDAGDFDEAIRLYNLGTKHYAGEDRFWSGLGIALWRKGDDERLRPVLEYLVGREYNNAGIRKKLAQMAFADEKFEEAIRWGRESLYIDVTDVEVHKLLADSYLKTGLPDKARRELEVVLELSPDNAEAKGLLESLGR